MRGEEKRGGYGSGEEGEMRRERKERERREAGQEKKRKGEMCLSTEIEELKGGSRKCGLQESCE